jgi:hypothetical protein
MRVLFYMPSSEWSATQRIIITAARGLVARGHPVTIACCSATPIEATAQAEGVETILINGGASAAGGAWDLRKVLHEKFIEVAVVTTGARSPHRCVGNALRGARRGAASCSVVRQARDPAQRKAGAQDGDCRRHRLV